MNKCIKGYDTKTGKPIYGVGNNRLNKNNYKYFNKKIEYLPKKDYKTIFGILLGMISIFLSFVINIYAIPFSILGLFFSFKTKERNYKRLIAIFLNFGILLFLILIVGFSILFKNFNEYLFFII